MCCCAKSLWVSEDIYLLLPMIINLPTTNNNNPLWVVRILLLLLRRLLLLFLLLQVIHQHPIHNNHNDKWSNTKIWLSSQLHKKLVGYILLVLSLACLLATISGLLACLLGTNSWYNLLLACLLVTSSWYNNLLLACLFVGYSLVVLSWCIYMHMSCCTYSPLLRCSSSINKRHKQHGIV